MKRKVVQLGYGAFAGMCLFMLVVQPLQAQPEAAPPPRVAEEQAAPNQVEASAGADERSNMEEKRRVRAEVALDSGETWHESIVPLAGIFAVFGLPALISVLALYYAYRRSKLRHETLLALADRGVDISNLDLIEPTSKKDKSPINDLRTGLVLLGTGLGISIMLWVLGIGHIAGVGTVPALIGLAYICVYAVRRKSVPVE